MGEVWKARDERSCVCNCELASSRLSLTDWGDDPLERHPPRPPTRVSGSSPRVFVSRAGAVSWRAHQSEGGSAATRTSPFASGGSRE